MCSRSRSIARLPRARDCAASSTRMHGGASSANPASQSDQGAASASAVQRSTRLPWPSVTFPACSVHGSCCGVGTPRTLSEACSAQHWRGGASLIPSDRRWPIYAKRSHRPLTWLGRRSAWSERWRTLARPCRRTWELPLPRTPTCRFAVMNLQIRGHKRADLSNEACGLECRRWRHDNNCWRRPTQPEGLLPRTIVRS